MSIKQLSFLKPRGAATWLIAVVLAFQVQLLAAATIQIQFSGLDIEYDGMVLSTSGGADPLNTVTLIVDGSVVETLVGPADAIFADLAVAVTDIPAGGGMGTITSDPAGSFHLGLLTGGLTLDLEDAFVSYVSAPGFFDLVYSGAAASIAGQNLPFGLEIGEPVTMSFSTIIDPDSLMAVGMYLEAFTASGTGEIMGEAVPEPASILLLLPGLALLLASRRRSP